MISASFDTNEVNVTINLAGNIITFHIEDKHMVPLMLPHEQAARKRGRPAKVKQEEPSA